MYAFGRIHKYRAHHPLKTVRIDLSFLFLLSSSTMAGIVKRKPGICSVFFRVVPFLALSLVTATITAVAAPPPPQPNNVPSPSPGVITMDMTRERQQTSLVDLIQTSVMNPLEDTVKSLLHPSSYQRHPKEDRRLYARKQSSSTLTNTIWSVSYPKRGQFQLLLS
ncbi:hypothetical protein BX666DRAFT_1558722 [Dichotomocladium elegans]|nr:hypothetical protein BX666DRAFT_1558722 [Dichotomocladium elegans]